MELSNDCFFLDWRSEVRKSEAFTIVYYNHMKVSNLMKSQLTYARKIKKPIYHLIPSGKFTFDIREGEKSFYYMSEYDRDNIIKQIQEGLI